MSPSPPTFQEYSQALDRLRRRAHLRRAVMTRGLSTSLEMPCLDDDEIRDRQLCQCWQDENGYYPSGY